MVRADEQCPTPVTCSDGKRVYAPQTCDAEPCPDGSIAKAGEKCGQPPPCWTCKFFPMTSETLPNWVALIALIAALGGGGVIAARIHHSRLVAKTKSLLALRGAVGTLDTSLSDHELEPDGPAIGLRAYFGPEET